ncbi:MAG TPA: ClC family H(+)/Cl(-) exchange transporter, partial [Candidatus Melainabacteria bacterium]|nr:ClC family H(+)/Cl(-) exchange transporter [Candidatus Melainabacteria bacterium]
NSFSRLVESILSNRSHQAETTGEVEHSNKGPTTAEKPNSATPINVIEIVAVGILTAAAAFALSKSVGWLGALRIQLSQSGNFWVLPLFGLIGGVMCGVIVKFIAPEITGSGIPQVKGFLRGHPIRMNLVSLLAKLAAGILSLGCGLPLGREGPTVQIGASLSGMFVSLLKSGEKLKRHFIAAGAGAGLAAAFNAPLAGVIFVVEELVREVSSTFVITAGLACFAAATMSDLLGNHSLDLSSHTDFPSCEFRFADIPYLIILGIVCGALGSFFNWLIIKGMTCRTKIFKQNYPLSIGLAGLICGLTVTLLPTGMHNFAGIKYLIIGHTPGLSFAATALAVSFFITIISYVSGAPGGLFGPSLTIGAATGYLLGATELGEWASASNAPDLFALAGMGAFFSGVARVPITATVIVFEITRDFNLLLPLLMTTMVAYTVGEKIYAGSVYDRLLELSSGAQNQEQKPEHKLEHKPENQQQKE